jgi:uncharacterized protein (TIGR02300 family)
MAWAAPLTLPLMPLGPVRGPCPGRLVLNEGPIIVMAKPELGTKRTCVACGARFYDLTKSPAVCPKCGTDQPVDQPRPRRAGGNVVEDKRPKKAPAAPEDVDVEVEGVEEGEDEDVLEATDDLEDDADSISSDIEVESDGDENER